MNVNGKHLTAALLLTAAAIGFWVGPHPAVIEQAPEVSPKQPHVVAAPPQLPPPQTIPEPSAKEPHPATEALPGPSLERNPYHEMQDSLGGEIPRADPSVYAERAVQIQGQQIDEIENEAQR